MKRAWFQRIRGEGCQTLVKGKNPCFITLWFSTLLICHLVVSPNLVNLFNAQLVVEELWLLVDGQLFPLGVGWQNCQSFSHIHTPPTTPCLPCLFCSPHAPVHCAHGILFLSTSCCSPSRRELLLLLTHSQFRVLSAVVVHPRAQEEMFIPHGV